MARILVAGPEGLVAFDSSGGQTPMGLEDRRVRALAPETRNKLWAIVEGREIWRCAGGEWSALIDRLGNVVLESLRR